MKLDYSTGCVNFRDVGEFVNCIAGQAFLQEGRLFRGGKLQFVRSPDEVNNPRTIINLRRGGEDRTFEAVGYHCPIANELEVYDTASRGVRRWLHDVMALCTSDEVDWPILVHCLSGKDRTGVVVAAVLKIIGLPDEIIIEEYLLSDGDVRVEFIQHALAGIGSPSDYFRPLPLDRLAHHLLLSAPKFKR